MPVLTRDQPGRLRGSALARTRPAVTAIAAAAFVVVTAVLVRLSNPVAGSATVNPEAVVAMSPTPAAPSPAEAPGPIEVAEPALAPALQRDLGPAYQHVVGSWGDGSTVYLSFDDGPTDYTPQILDVLAASNAKATFCLIGSQVSERPDLVERVIAEGHTLCNHSRSHPQNMGEMPAEEIAEQIADGQRALAEFGVLPRYFRSPGGSFGVSLTLRQVCQAYEVVPLGWAVDSEDWHKFGPEKIAETVLAKVEPGDVVLLHDGGGDRSQTVAALPRIIAGLQAKGYTLAALPAGGLS